jgi:hypothetical protein
MGSCKFWCMTTSEDARRGPYPLKTMAALDALADLHRTLDDDEGEAWLSDARNADRLLSQEVRDPWA